VVAFPSRPGWIAGCHSTSAPSSAKRREIIGIPRLDGALDRSPRSLATSPAQYPAAQWSVQIGDPSQGTIGFATVPFTLRNLKEDLDDVGSNFDGAPDLEFRLATKALELEESGLGYQRVPPGYRFPYGHTHRKQEEVYVVLRGSGRMKLDDEIVELKEWDAVRVPPGTWRGYEAGPDGLEIFVIGAPNLGEAPRDDVEGQRDWWAD
jgi:mannose-6-phosphate isomerase-like protein (cupin superfamily)